MQYSDLNSTIRDTIKMDRESGRRHRLMFYALNPMILPDREYYAFSEWLKKNFKSDEDKSRFIQNNIWFMSLYFIRLFFEKTDGASYNSFSKEKLGFTNKVPIGEDVISKFVANQLFEDIDRSMSSRYNMQKFLLECWMFMLGPASEMWHCLTPLIRSLPDQIDFSDTCDYIEDYISEFSDPPFSLERLANERDPDFVYSIRIMKGLDKVNETGWYPRLTAAWKDHKKGNSANIGWVIDVSRESMRILLAIKDLTIGEGRKEIEFVQKGVKPLKDDLSKVPHRKIEVSECCYELLDYGLSDHFFSPGTSIDPRQQFSIRIGKGKAGLIKVPGIKFDFSTGDFLLFKLPFGKQRGALVVPDTKLVYSPRMIIIWSDEFHEPPTLFWGDTCLRQYTENRRANFNFGFRRNSLWTQTVTIPGSLRDEAQSLYWREDNIPREIIRIGVRPSFAIREPEEDVRVVDSIHQIRFSDDDVILDVVNASESFEFEQTKLKISGASSWKINRENYGESVSIQSDECKIVSCRYEGMPGFKFVRFPSDAREVILGKTDLPGWIWEESEFDPKEGNEPSRQRGVLRSPTGIEFSLEIPLQKLMFWWKGKGIHFRDIERGMKNFNSFAQLAEKALCVYTPQRAELMLNDEKQKTIDAGYCEIDLYNELSSVNEDAIIYSFSIGNTEVADILSDPDQPQITFCRQKPVIRFPLDESFNRDNYYIIHILEDRILAPIYLIPCASNQLDSGKEIPLETTSSGYWIALVKSPDRPSNLLEFCFGSKSIEKIVEVNESPNVPLEQRLLGNSCFEMNPDDRQWKLKKIRAYLDLIETQRKCGDFPDQVLSTALSDRNLLDVDNEYLKDQFEEFFEAKCSLEDLEKTIQNLLDSSYNVFSIDQWLQSAMEKIRSKYEKFTEKRKETLLKIASAIPVVIDIQAGFPCNRRKKKKLSRIDKELCRLDFLFKPNEDAVRISCPGSFIPDFTKEMKVIGMVGYRDPRKSTKIRLIRPSDRLRAIEVDDSGKIKVNDNANNNECIKIEYINPITYASIITYHGTEEVEFPEHLLGIPEYKYGISRAIEADRFLLTEHADKLNEIFSMVLLASPKWIGSLTDNHLATFFDRKVQMCKEIENEVDYENRTNVLQAVVISRLVSKNTNITLSDSDNRIVCEVLAQAYRHCRFLLMNDLAVVEWLLTWFSEPKDTSGSGIDAHIA